MKKIVVLLSTYNGEKYLKELLDSVLAQIEINLDIYIRDDGSSDRTKEILKNYTEVYDNIKVVFGNNLGYAKSFWWLIQNVRDYDYYALCDQDDIWKREKLSIAIEKIGELSEDIPVLYTSDVTPFNEKGIVSSRLFNVNNAIDKYESFQKSILPGCTFVFNNKAHNLLLQYNGYMESHDWAIYAIINMFGKVLYDCNNYIYYRLHENNTIGKSTVLEEYIIKIKRFFKPSKCTRSKFAKDFYETYKNLLTEEDNSIINNLAYYTRDYKKKYNLLFCNKF